MEFTWKLPGEAVPWLYPAALREDWGFFGGLSGFSPDVNNLLPMFSALISVLWSHGGFGIMLRSFHVKIPGTSCCPA